MRYNQRMDGWVDSGIDAIRAFFNSKSSSASAQAELERERTRLAQAQQATKTALVIGGSAVAAIAVLALMPGRRGRR